MEITGKLIQLLPEVQGESARGPWVRGGFVIETGDDYPRKVAFTAFGEERVAMAKNVPMGTMVQVTFTPESREFNDSLSCLARCRRPPATTAGTPLPVPLPPRQPLPSPPHLQLHLHRLSPRLRPCLPAVKTTCLSKVKGER